jgi:hypothetical protein
VRTEAERIKALNECYDQLAETYAEAVQKLALAERTLAFYAEGNIDEGQNAKEVLVQIKRAAAAM